MVSQFIYIPPRSLKHPFHLQELRQLTPTGPCFNACGFCGCSTMLRYQFVESTTEHSHIASRSMCVCVCVSVYSICMYHDKSSATTHTHGVMSQTSQSHMSHVTTSMRHSHKARSEFKLLYCHQQFESTMRNSDIQTHDNVHCTCVQLQYAQETVHR